MNDGTDDGARCSELSRRELIRRAAIVAGIGGVSGGLAWATPVVDSFLDERKGSRPEPAASPAGPRQLSTGPNCCQCANRACGCIQVTTFDECAIYCGDPAYRGLAEILGTVASLRDGCGPPDFRVGQSCTPEGCR
ncbi:MAG TPA: hypothetical protein VHG90_14400 [Acidimicrobiales bacterium]|nr:hypothetical protein [Acidimicrobiales bacterium]